MKTIASTLEILESRIAPAGIFTYLDVDGDTVKITSSGASTNALLSAAALFSGAQLQQLNLTNAVFTGSNISVTVIGFAAGSDHLANVGYINSAGHSLGNVFVNGDVGQIDAGGMGALTVRSIGRLGTDTQAGGNLQSDIVGSLGSLTVGADVKDAFVRVTGNIGPINIHGSLIGGVALNSGKISSFGNMGAVTIGHDLQGGFGSSSGLIQSSGTLGNVTIGGSLIGGGDGSTSVSGEIYSGGNMGLVTIGHDMTGSVGGSGNSGFISSSGNLAGVHIFGSLIGGSNSGGGEIFSHGNMGLVQIGHNVEGGAGFDSGFIHSDGNFTVVSIGGSLIGGSNIGSGKISTDHDCFAVTVGHNVQGGSGVGSGFIDIKGTLTVVNIGGSLLGGSNTDSGAIHSGGGIFSTIIGHNVQGSSGTGSGFIHSNGFGTVLIGGSVLGGTNTDSGAIFSDAHLGLVTIRHDVKGDAGFGSGRIESTGNLAGVHIFGSLLGGSSGAAPFSPVSSGGILSLGNMGAVTIGHDVAGGSGFGGTIHSEGTLANVSVGGSLIGGAGDNSGAISSKGDMSVVTIGRDVLGYVDASNNTVGFGSGRIQSGSNVLNPGNLAGVHIGGSLIGGSNVGMAGSLVASGGVLSYGNMGAVTIGHDLIGGSGFSGHVQSGGTLGNVTIGGSLIGGPAVVSGVSGEIFSTLDMGNVTIGHDFTGSGITGSDSLDRSGYITSSTGRIPLVHIFGSIISGIDNSTGSLHKNASISAHDDIGTLIVGGSIIGHGDSGNGASPVVISARGQHTPTATDVAIGLIGVGHRVEFANILAGYDIGFPNLTASNGHAQIGLVFVNGDWVASNLVAGVTNLGAGNAVGGVGANADNVNYGDSHDFPIGALHPPGIVARIAGIFISGQVFGTPNSTSTTDHFGFVAEEIGGMNIGGNNVPVTFGPHSVGDNHLVGETFHSIDVKIHEV